MARGFKYVRGMDKTYAEQGEIFFVCQRYRGQTEATRSKIRRLCREAGGEFERALFDYLTTPKSWKEIVTQYHLGEATLHRLRKRFYESW